MSNVKLIRQAYEDFAAGNIEAVLSVFDPGIEWRECTGFPFVKGEGISIGPGDVANDVFSQLPVHYDGFRIEITDLIGTEDKVVMQGFYHGTWKPTGKAFKANAVHSWTLKDGKITKFFQAVDTAEIVNA
jgi:ketosteroid isomerase-like protein